MPVHPHACGEHPSPVYRPLARSGSSPRLWGTHMALRRSIEIERFIPTPVGNTSVAASHWSAWSVHPHACGEHKKLKALMKGFFGSSPRLWGTLIVLVVVPFPVRFIPTPVGNTQARYIAHSRDPVHPHACGEHRRSQGQGYLFLGSSPRLWGTHFL